MRTQTICFGTLDSRNLYWNIGTLLYVLGLGIYKHCLNRDPYGQQLNKYRDMDSELQQSQHNRKQNGTVQAMQVNNTTLVFEVCDRRKQARSGFGIEKSLPTSVVIFKVNPRITLLNLDTKWLKSEYVNVYAPCRRQRCE